MVAGLIAETGIAIFKSAFERWLDDFKREAVTQGVSQRTIASAAHLMVYDQQVVNKDRGQKVFSQTFLEFSDRMVAKHRIDGLIAKLAERNKSAAAGTKS